MELNVFSYYHVVERGYCGNSDVTKNYLLVTPLSEEQVKKLMRECAESLPVGEEFCYVKFIESFSEGVFIETENEYIDGGLLGKEIDLDKIKVEDLYSEKKMSEIIAHREEQERIRRQKEREEREKSKIASDKRQDERDIKRLQQRGYVIK